MTISITKPTVGGSENTWGTTVNTALDAIVDGINGTSGTIAPDLSTLTINGTDVTATAAELNYIEGATSNVQTQLDNRVTSNADDALTGGYTATADDDGTKSTGTYTPNPAGGNLKRIVNGGAFTLAAPTASGDYTLIIQMTNNASAGAVTLSGFNKEVGDPILTTDGNDYFLFITKINGFSSITVQELQ
jgi:hypothetical protein